MEISSEQASCCVSRQAVSAHRMGAMGTLNVGTTHGLPGTLGTLDSVPPAHSSSSDGHKIIKIRIESDF